MACRLLRPDRRVEMTRRADFLLFAGTVCAALLLSANAFAQAEGISKQDAASAGATDVDEGGFAGAAEAEAEAKDATELKVSAGGLQTTGNTRSLAATSSGQFRLRRELNQLSAIAAANYARSAPDASQATATTVENFQGKVRYDRFVLEELAVFIATTGRRDRFQGLDLRLNVDPGVAYYFVDEKLHRFWAELGYDFQYDVRNDDNINAAALQGIQVDKTNVQHSARSFIGYSNSLTEAVTLDTGLEYLQGIPETERWRLNWDAGVTSKIGGNFSLATTFSLKYDHHPLPAVEKLDTVTALSLVYQLL
jgi:putative salt-induced outer membrane protein YdiY